ncbi:unnamed protein product [Rangifer tarandus platyrhynchus]|uniref:Olfactory receptor n=1 Tax=Rangifer tarandus platyrhynchus TaxID=3082113 RepID=A0ABN8XWA3_RANTA|nr:unnamed protein product [Rangifer tarandus platyrhynchus]
MGRRNITHVSDFILMGLTDSEEIRLVLFTLFLLIYLITVLGNVGMILVICLDPQLHTPMYFFLSHLSFLDLSYSIITPKMLVDFMSKNKAISFLECATQMFLAVTFGTTECFLLAAMAYDRYVAIYNPLRYPVSMAPRVYVPLIIASYVGGILHASVHTVATFSLSFCASNEIRHVFCDIPPLLAISCSDTHTNQLLLFYFVGSIEIVTVLSVLISYGFILLAILRMHSAEGRRKAFSTCGSHLAVVVVLYATLAFMYMQPKASHSFDTDKMASVFFTLVIPMLNPMIYSLRNKEVKGALRKVWKNLCKIPI